MVFRYTVQWYNQILFSWRNLAGWCYSNFLLTNLKFHSWFFPWFFPWFMFFHVFFHVFTVSFHNFSLLPKVLPKASGHADPADTTTFSAEATSASAAKDGDDTVEAVIESVEAAVTR